MTFNNVILFIVAVGVILGGADKLMGNKFGLGAKFDEGFNSMGDWPWQWQVLLSWPRYCRTGCSQCWFRYSA